MAEISKISGVAIADVAKVDAILKADIANINGLTLPSAFTGLLDTYTGAAAAYSVRRLNSLYTGACMRVREDGTNTETDIGFDANGDLDTAAIATHCGANNGYVKTWYDQSQSGGTGSGNDADQATAALQPQIYNGAAVITHNSKPAVEFLKNGHLALTDTGATNTVCQLAVAEFDTSVSTNNMLMGSSNTFWQMYTSGNLRIQTTNSDRFTFGSLTNGDQYLGFINAAAGSYTTFVNGTSTGSSSMGDWRIDNIGRGLGSDAFRMDGRAQEIIQWKSDQSSNRTGIESNLNTYFSIY